MESSVQDFNLSSKLADRLFRSLGVVLPDETPLRFVKMLSDLTAYQNISNQEIESRVNKLFDIGDCPRDHNMVIVKDIDAFSLCEHHVALMYDMKVAVAYIPKEKVLGLSKIVRIVDMVCKRLQLQERIGSDIMDIMKNLTSSEDIAVHIKAKHSCVTARGIQNKPSVTETTNFSGKFLQHVAIQQSFIKSVCG